MSSSSEAKTPEEYAAKISADFKIKECPAFVHFAGKQARGAKLLAFNDADIPLTKDGFGGKQQVLTLALLSMHCQVIATQSLTCRI